MGAEAKISVAFYTPVFFRGMEILKPYFISIVIFYSFKMHLHVFSAHSSGLNSILSNKLV